jgi:hypothetical protein
MMNVIDQYVGLRKFSGQVLEKGELVDLHRWVTVQRAATNDPRSADQIFVDLLERYLLPPAVPAG